MTHQKSNSNMTTLPTINNWQWLDLEKTASTNDDAKAKKSQIIITARTQTNGRGRRGRSWESLDGNLFLSISLSWNIKYLAHLVFISSLSLAQTIKELSPDANIDLKWPNDVLLNESKVSGILLEKGEDNFIVVGIGVNIKASPKDKKLIYPATSLKQAGIKTDRIKFLKNYMNFFDANLTKTFDVIKKDWLSMSNGLNREIVIRNDDLIRIGTFIGIDENANLLLKTKNGIETILTGDVFYQSKDD